jgi:hypothetical protein
MGIYFKVLGIAAEREKQLEIIKPEAPPAGPLAYM